MAPKEARYRISLHAEHPCLIEIFEETEYQKAQRVEGGYTPLASTQTYEEALQWVQSMLEALYERDPQMKSIKSQLLHRGS